MISRSRTVATKDWKGILYHEYGHLATHYMHEDVLMNASTLQEGLAQICSPVEQYIRNYAKIMGETEFSLIQNMLVKYAAGHAKHGDYSEIVAEAFASYYYGYPTDFERRIVELIFKQRR